VSLSDKVKFQINGAIARITLDRPEKLHALDQEMLSALEDAVGWAEQSRDVRVIVLESSGDKAFCVGADILAWTALSPLEMWAEWVLAHPFAAALESLASAANAFTDDAKEGLAAFREKRSPQFKGH
jgi:enoyl-CoA hydratase/carnithine racemase